MLNVTIPQVPIFLRLSFLNIFTSILKTTWKALKKMEFCKNTEKFDAWIIHWKEREKKENSQFLWQLIWLDERLSHHSYPNVYILVGTLAWIRHYFKKKKWHFYVVQAIHFGTMYSICAALEILWASEKFKIHKHKKASMNYNFNIIEIIFI